MKVNKHIQAFIFSLATIIALNLAIPLVSVFANSHFPTGPITVVIPWPPGGRSDIEARAWSPFGAKEVGAPVVVANRPGGVGIVGAKVVANSKADGYTMGSFSAVHLIKQHTVKPPFELAAYTPVAQVADYSYTITVHANSPWRTLQELIAYAKANPGKIKHGTSGGAGSATHVAMNDFAKTAGIDIKIIHYKGDRPAVTATAGKEVHFCGAPVSAVKSMVSAGKLRILAITSPKRSPLYPHIPTVREQGISWDAVNFSFLAAPKGTPAKRIAVLEKMLGKVLNLPEVIKIYKRMDVQLNYKNSKDTASFLKKEDARYLRILKELGLVKN